ncbi:hypothetical protein MSAN_01407100 [Mycena sanguinolenta]|uniref:Uncharacterized protein n=1 Tax=Mycena sanguinolenta TaxID=230812 RepID=A0A8H6Y809_9AGAR|nr:hypothetical protein MSAN_01407100 [Mycena sanguinolenta]
MTLSSRLEIHFQLSCPPLDPNMTSLAHEAPVHYSTLQPSLITFLNHLDNVWNVSDSGQQLSRQCIPNSADAVRMYTMISIATALLSALTTVWWGQFGDRFGRTKVLAICTFGLFLSDAIFLLASAPFASHGRMLVLLVPLFDGLPGGWLTLHSGTLAYISDCTSSGSRTSIFSRFAGISVVGSILGSMLGGWLIRHPISFFSGLTYIFCVAAIASFLNFCFVLFVIPESVNQEQRDRASARMAVAGEAASRNLTRFGIIKDFFSPFAIFLPVSVSIPGSTWTRKDWSLMIVTCVMFGYMLSAAIYPINYLYALYVFSWDIKQLPYYIWSIICGQAIFLLLVFPLIIARFKPKSTIPQPQPAVPGVEAAKLEATMAHIASEMKFDLRLARLCLCIDIFANTAIVLVPAPSLHQNVVTHSQFSTSQTLFVVASSIAAWGTGLLPSTQSLALSILQARALLAESAQEAAIFESTIGKLLSIIVVVQAVVQGLGQMILGSLLLGSIYNRTASVFPKAVFVTVVGILFATLLVTKFVRSPVMDVKGKLPARGQPTAEEAEDRGRSPANKDLQRGYGSTGEIVASTEQFGSGPGGSN